MTGGTKQVNGTNALAIEHLENRFLRFEDDFLDLRDRVSDNANSQSRLEPAIAILSSQMKGIVNRPSNMWLALGVATAIIALALTPVAWLAMNNAERVEKLIEIEIAVAEERGYLRARVEALSHADHEHEARLRVLEQLRMLQR